MNLRTPERFEKPKADSSYLKCFFSQFPGTFHQAFLFSCGCPSFFWETRWEIRIFFQVQGDLPSAGGRFHQCSGSDFRRWQADFFSENPKWLGKFYTFFDIFLGIWCFIFLFWDHNWIKELQWLTRGDHLSMFWCCPAAYDIFRTWSNSGLEVRKLRWMVESCKKVMDPTNQADEFSVQKHFLNILRPSTDEFFPKSTQILQFEKMSVHAKPQ